MDKVKSLLSFHEFWVEDIVFKRNPLFSTEDKPSLDCKFHVSHRFNEEDKTKLTLLVGCELFSEDFTESDNPFYLNVTVCGFFSVEDNSDQDPNLKDKILKANTVAILFPYIRSAISSITLNANMPPVIIPPINTFQLMENANKTQND